MLWSSQCNQDKIFRKKATSATRMALAHSAAKKNNLPSTDHSAIKHHNHTANQAISAIKQPSIFSVPYIIFLPKSEKGFRWILRLPTSKFNTQLTLTTEKPLLPKCLKQISPAIIIIKTTTKKLMYFKKSVLW